MPQEVIVREAAWMVPMLIAAGVVLLGALVAMVVWIFTTFRGDINKRLDAQDKALLALTGTVSEIKDLLTAEVGKILGRVWSHHSQLTEHGARLHHLERHLGVAPPPPPRRHDDQEPGG